MDLTSLPVIPTSATALLALVVLLVLWGKLVPKSYLDELRAEKDARIVEVKEDRDLWKAAYENELSINRELTGQVSLLSEVGRTADHVIRSLPAAAAAVEGSRDNAVSTSQEA